MFVYVLNDPVNFVDPLGLRGGGVSGGGSFNFFGFRFSIAIEGRIIHDSNRSLLDPSSYSGGFTWTESHSNILQQNNYSLTLGAEADIGTGWLFTNADTIDQIVGYSETTFGVAGGWVSGGSFEYSVMTDKCGNKIKNNKGKDIWEFSAQHWPFPGLNFGFESHTKNINTTHSIVLFGYGK